MAAPSPNLWHRIFGGRGVAGGGLLGGINKGLTNVRGRLAAADAGPRFEQIMRDLAISEQRILPEDLANTAYARKTWAEIDATRAAKQKEAQFRQRIGGIQDQAQSLLGGYAKRSRDAVGPLAARAMAEVPQAELGARSFRGQLPPALQRMAAESIEPELLAKPGVWEPMLTAGVADPNRILMGGEYRPIGDRQQPTTEAFAPYAAQVTPQMTQREWLAQHPGMMNARMALDSPDDAQRREAMKYIGSPPPEIQTQGQKFAWGQSLYPGHPRWNEEVSKLDLPAHRVTSLTAKEMRELAKGGVSPADIQGFIETGDPSLIAGYEEPPPEMTPYQEEQIALKTREVEATETAADTKEREKNKKEAASDQKAIQAGWTTLIALQRLREGAFEFGAQGAGAKALSFIGGTPAANQEAAFRTLHAVLAFKELQEMRANSPTGGALGAISEREIDLLGSTVVGLSQSMSDDELLRSLNIIEPILRKIVALPEIAGVLKRSDLTSDSRKEDARRLIRGSIDSVRWGAPTSKAQKKAKALGLKSTPPGVK